MGIEKDRFGREIEVNDAQDEMADYLRPPPGQEKITGRKPLDEALRIIRHEVINMEQDRAIRKEVMRKMKEEIDTLRIDLDWASGLLVVNGRDRYVTFAKDGLRAEELRKTHKFKDIP